MAILTLAYLYLMDGLLNLKFPVHSRSVTVNQLRQQRIVTTLNMSLLLAAGVASRLLT